MQQYPNRKDLSVSLLAANVFGLITGLLPALFFVLLFSLVWSGREVGGQLPLALDGAAGILLLLALLLIGIVVHEGLHALGWMVFGGQPREVMEFGVKQLTPYAHCKCVMPVRGYRWGTLLPGLLMGVLPSLVAVATGNVILLGIGFFFTFVAGGDFLVLWLLRRVPRDALVEDHPERAGCYVYPG